LSPWWLRPTAEGATNEPESDEKREAASRAASQEPASPEPPPARPEPPPASFPRAEAFEPRPVAPFHQPAPAGDTRETPREEAAEPPATAAVPAEAAWEPAAWEPAPEAYAEPQQAGPSPTETAAPAAEAASQAAEMSPAAEGAPLADPDSAEREDGQGERKRSRSRRGRRRKSGRGAGAPTNGAAAAAGDDEEEDYEAEDEAMEAEAPAPVAQIQHRDHRAREAARPADDSFYLPPDYELAPREVFVPVERPRSHSDEKKIALFCDLENIALGVRDSEVGKFDIHRVLERLLEKGKIIVKKAYADWERYSDYKRPFHEAAIELIDIPQKYYSGKNSADIKMVVDAMDLSYSKEHLDTFVLLSGDSDF